MTKQGESGELTIRSVVRSETLHRAVRNVLRPTRAWLRAGVIATGVAAAIPSATAAPFPPVFPLGSLLPSGGGDGTQGFVLTGASGGDNSGNAVSAAGDINGDGLDDLIVGALHADPGGRSSAGESYVVFGSQQPFPALFPLASLYSGNGTRGFVLTGIGANDLSGNSVSAAGDVNGDGIDDLIIGAIEAGPGGSSSAGASYVVFGSTQGFPAILSLASLLPAGGGDGTRGFVLGGVDADDACGTAVSAAGDVNGDGIDDLIVGAEFADPGGDSGAGESYVIFGSAQGFPAVFPLASLLPGGGGDGSRGFVLAGIDLEDFSGRSVSAAGDLNADGIDDLVIGAYRADPGGRGTAGESYVIFGSMQGFPAVIPLASLYPAGGGDGTRGFVLAGIGVGDRSGSAVSTAGDVNQDGIDDLIIGASGRHFFAGESYVIFGSAQDFPAVLPLASLIPAGGGDGTRGFVLRGIDAYDNAGSVSTAGDVNGDGIDDVIVGAASADPGGNTSAGESYVVFGSSQHFAAVLPLASLYPIGGGDGSRGFVLAGSAAAAHSGGSVSAAGDVNGDGIDDLIIGASDAEFLYNGESYVVFGRSAADAR